MKVHKFGDIVVDTDYEKPTLDRFLKWRDDFLWDIEGIDIDILFMGNAAEKFYGNSTLETNDIDIFLHSKNIEPIELRHVFYSAINRGAENKLYIDIIFFEYDVFNTHWPTEPHYLIRPYFNITYKDGTSSQSARRYKKIDKDLYKSEVKRMNYSSIKKHEDRIKNGDYLGLRFDLRTMDYIEI